MVLSAAWLVAVGLIVLRPSPVDTGSAGLLRQNLTALQRLGFPAWFDYGFVEFTANIIMFIPLGLFFFMLAPRGWRWGGPLAGIVVSSLIEITQLVVLPQRVASPYDVVANCLGALVGTVIGWMALRSRIRTSA